MSETFQEKLQQQLNELHTNIISGTNQSFKIFNLEAGLGKSIQAEKSMVDAYLNHGRKTLYVCQFKDTGSTNTIHERINKIAGKNISMAVDASNKQHIKFYMQYPILIITHEKYKQLSYNATERKKYTEGRCNLIIDEMPNMVNIFIYTKERIQQIHTLLPMVIRNQYDKIVAELDDCLTVNKHTKNVFFNTKKKYARNLNTLKSIIQNNIELEHIVNKTLSMCRYDYENNKETQETIPITKSILLNEVEILRNFYTNTCCVDRGKIYTYDKRIQYFGLDNNLILDANGGFQELYNLNNIFNNSCIQEKIVDHNNWTMNTFFVNTNTTAKSKYTNFNEIVQNMIDKNADSKSLLISSKQHKLNFKNIETEHFGNLIGKNTWRDYNKIFIVHNPQTPFYVYILKYLYYSDIKLDNRSSWSTIITKGVNKTVNFQDERFELVRVSDLCGHIYQAIKRINRDNSQQATIYLFNSDEDVINLIIKQMQNINVKCYFLDNVKKEKTKKSEQEVITFPDKFIQLLDLIRQKDPKVLPEELKQVPGKLYTYTKQSCMNVIGYGDETDSKTRTNFSKQILKNLDVIQFMSNNSFIAKGQNIVWNGYRSN